MCDTLIKVIYIYIICLCAHINFSLFTIFLPTQLHSLRAWAANEKGHDRSRSDKIWISPELAKPDWEWMHLEKSISFNELYSYSETPETALYELLKIRVKEEGVVIEIDDLYFGKPPTKEETSPTNGEPSTPVGISMTG